VEPGEKIGRQYLLTEVVGVGRNGEVWLARDERAGRDVVLKPVRMAGDGKSAIARLRALPRAMARFRDHPHLVPLHTTEERDGSWLVMEYVPGGSLDRRPPMSPQEAARVGAQIADALEALHTAGMVHCDVKPAGIGGLVQRGAAKLLDFGAAFQVGGPISYTPDYAAPELTQGNLMPASDVFSLGMTLYALVTGSPLRERRVSGERLAHQRPERRVLGPLDGVLQAMLQPDPGDRPDAAEAKRFLTAAANGIPMPQSSATPHLPPAPQAPQTAPIPQAPRPPDAPDDPNAPRKPREWLVAAAGAVALAVIAVALVWFTQPGGDSPSSQADAEAPPASQQGEAAEPGEPGEPGEGAGTIAPPEEDMGMTSPSPSDSESAPSQPPSPEGVGAQSASLIGDQRTADPCALTDESALAQFGQVDLDNDYGNFERCDVLVSPEDDVWVDVSVSFTERSQIEDALRDPVPARTVGEIGIAESAAEPDECERALLLPSDADSGTVVRISASTDDGGSPPLCAMADAAATSAANELDSLVESDGQIPRRNPPPVFTDESLIWVDACDLPDGDALATIPGINADAPYGYFGAWQCGWTSDNGETYVGLTYDRGDSMRGDDDVTPFPVGYRRGFLLPEADGADTCTAWVEQREYIDEYGETAVEHVRVWVEGVGRSEDRLCDWARDLASSTAGQLPPT
jgi:eukaryotic-like serine/threonine-protein kinase